MNFIALALTLVLLVLFYMFAYKKEVNEYAKKENISFLKSFFKLRGLTVLGVIIYVGPISDLIDLIPINSLFLECIVDGVFLILYCILLAYVDEKYNKRKNNDVNTK